MYCMSKKSCKYLKSQTLYKNEQNVCTYIGILITTKIIIRQIWCNNNNMQQIDINIHLTSVLVSNRTAAKTESIIK